MAHDILLDSGTNEVEILEFILGDQSFGINVAKVIQIIAYDDSHLTELPEVESSILGVLQWREHSVSLIDLNGALRRKTKTGTERPIVLVTNFNAATNGFLIDSVNRIHRLSWDQIDPPSEFIEQYSSSITGSIHMDGREIQLIDFECIIAELFPETKLEFELDIPEAKSELKRENTKIIFAEDSKLIRTTMTSVLKKAGFNITVFENGKDALKHITRLKKKAEKDGKNITDLLNLVITDIEMPQMDGLTVCKLLKTELKLSDIPVIIFSSLINEQMKYKCVEVGADAYITKPQAATLVNMIDKLLHLT